MKSSTRGSKAASAVETTVVSAENVEWQRLVAALPVDLEATAREYRALTRRRRVQSAADLLRIVLAYAVCDWSLRLLSGWCSLMGLADLSDVALLKRLRLSQRWLGGLIVAVLRQRRISFQALPAVRLRLVDATTISRPGSQGIDWRVHLSLDLGQLNLDAIEVTDAHGGETVVRAQLDPKAIHVIDQGYAKPTGLRAALAVSTPLIVRCHWQNLALHEPTGRLDVIAWLRQRCADPSTQRAERTVWFMDGATPYPLRLIASAIPLEAAERARRRLRRAARKAGHTPSAEGLYAAGFILLLTNLPSHDYPTLTCLAMYRLRWQVELAIKRLKSILHLDAVRARDSRLAQPYLLAKLLAALCLEDASRPAQSVLADWWNDETRPPSVWRLTCLHWEALVQAVRGVLSLARLTAHLSALARCVCDTPRRRRQHYAAARIWLASLVTC